MANALAALRAGREAEGRNRMTHRGWAPPEALERLRSAGKWLTGPVATDDYGNEIPNDASSLASLINSLVPHPGQSEEQMIENTLGFMIPSGGIGAARELARGPVGETALRIFAGPGAKTAGRKAGKVIGATKQELEAAQRNATELLGLPANNTRAERAQALAHVDDPLWRGGRPPTEAGEMGNQHWFTRDEGYAQGIASKPANELGKYVMLKNAESFPAHLPAALRHDDAMGVAAALRKDGHQKLADEFEQAAADGDFPLGHAAWVLKSQTGEPGMRKYLGAIGFDAIDDGRHVAVTGWGKGVMRDPNRAAFDPARLGDPSIYAGIAGLGAVPLLTRERSPDEY